MKSKIKAICKEKGINYRALALNVGITDRAIDKYERVGLAKAQFGVIVRIAKALNCSVHDLYE